MTTPALTRQRAPQDGTVRLPQPRRQRRPRSIPHGVSFGDGEDEPSLASTGMLDQRRWVDGGNADAERDRSEYEPSCDNEDVDDDSEISVGVDTGECGAEPRPVHANDPAWKPTPIEFSAPHAVTGEPGQWLMFPKEGAR